MHRSRCDGGDDDDDDDYDDDEDDDDDTFQCTIVYLLIQQPEGQLQKQHKVRKTQS